MKISTEIASIAKVIGEEKAIEYCAKAGFDAWDFSLFEMVRFDWVNRTAIHTGHPLDSVDYLKFARRLKAVGLENGIVCNQSHAPYPVYCDEIRSYMKRAIECTAEAGGQICVIHPDNYRGPEENAEMYLELLPFAKEHGVKLATENMWDWDKKLDQATFSACATPKSFNDHLDAVNDDFMVACLDLGHAEMRGLQTSAVEMIHALGKRLKALHIHDNDLKHDSHQIPFSMKMDFPAIVKALKEIGYDGYFTLEADQYMSAYSKENALEGVRKLAEAAKKLADMFEEA